MNDLRKAAEMALEALEAHADIGIKSDKAVKALRQALDKPEIEPQALVEMAVLAEREACAQVCEQIHAEYEGEEVLAIWCADAIRERSEK